LLNHIAVVQSLFESNKHLDLPKSLVNAIRAFVFFMLDVYSLLLPVF